MAQRLQEWESTPRVHFLCSELNDMVMNCFIQRESDWIPSVANWIDWIYCSLERHISFYTGLWFDVVVYQCTRSHNSHYMSGHKPSKEVSVNLPNNILWWGTVVSVNLKWRNLETTRSASQPKLSNQTWWTLLKEVTQNSHSNRGSEDFCREVRTSWNNNHLSSTPSVRLLY